MNLGYAAISSTSCDAAWYFRLLQKSLSLNCLSKPASSRCRCFNAQFHCMLATSAPTASSDANERAAAGYCKEMPMASTTSAFGMCSCGLPCFMLGQKLAAFFPRGGCCRLSTSDWRSRVCNHNPQLWIQLSGGCKICGQRNKKHAVLFTLQASGARTSKTTACSVAPGCSGVSAIQRILLRTLRPSRHLLTESSTRRRFQRAFPAVSPLIGHTLVCKGNTYYACFSL